MAAPTQPVVLFAQNNQIYVEFDTAACVGAISFALRYTQPLVKPVVFEEGTEDAESRKGTVRRYYFGTIPSTPYSFYAQAVYPTGPYGRSGFTNQTSNGPNAPPALVTIPLYADNTSIEIQTLVPIAAAGVQLFLLGKPVGAPFYDSVEINYVPGVRTLIESINLIPLTNYQYFVQTRTAEGITNGPVGRTATQANGCPVEQPIATLKYKTDTTLTVGSTFGNVIGDNLQAVGVLTQPNGQDIYSVINLQNDVARTSIHTFEGLVPNTRYSIFTLIRNQFGFQQSIQRVSVPTANNPPNPVSPKAGYVTEYDSPLGGKGILAGTLADTVFAPRVTLTLEFSPTEDFAPATIVNYAWTRLPVNPSIVTSNADLTPGTPGFFRARVFDSQRNSIWYSFAVPWDGIGAKKKI